MPLLTDTEKAAIQAEIAKLKPDADALKRQAANLATDASPAAAQAARDTKNRADAIAPKVAAELAKIPLAKASQILTSLNDTKNRLDSEHSKALSNLQFAEDWEQRALEKAAKAAKSLTNLQKTLQGMEDAPAKGVTVDQLTKKDEAFRKAKAAVDAARKSLDDRRILAAAHPCPSALWNPIAWKNYKPIDTSGEERALQDAEADLANAPGLSADEAGKLKRIASKKAEIAAAEQTHQDALEEARDYAGRTREKRNLEADARKALADATSKWKGAAAEHAELKKMADDLTKAADDATTAANVASGTTTAVGNAYKQVAKQRDAATGGHCVGRHGPEVSDAKLQERLTTGYAPDGVLSPTGSSGKFTSYEALVETQNAATQRLMANLGIANITDPDPAGRTSIAVNTPHANAIGSGFNGTGATAPIGDPARGGLTYAATTPRPPSTTTRTTFEYQGGRWVIAQHYPA